MKSVRSLVLSLFFLGLATLEIAHGLFRLEALRERQRRGLLERIERQYRDLATEIREALLQKRQHAACLAAAPAVGEVLAAPRDRSVRHSLQSLLLPYLLAFGGLDRIRLLDDGGHELFRCERMGGAAGVLPESLLATEPDREILALVDGLPPGEVAMSSLVFDRDRVEVPESDRQVLHYAAEVVGSEGRRGILVLTVYAWPLLRAIRRYEPVKGVSAVLVNASGRYMNGTGSQPGDPGVRFSSLFEEHVQVASKLLSGAERVQIEGLTYTAVEVHEKPRWVLVGRVPERALEEAASDLRGEYGWIIGSTVALTAILALAAAFLVRMSARELRLREHSRYLQRIRKESEKYRALMDGAADMILIVDPDTAEIRESNALARELLPLPGPASVSSEPAPASLPTLARVLEEGGLDAFRDALRAARDGERAGLSDIRVRGRDGAELNVDARLVAIDLEEARVIEVSLRDLTRQRELEMRLRISERLGSLGLLTAGVAHEINNPLEGIGNYLALLERETIEAERRTRYLELIRHGLDRIRDIVRDLGSFARSREGSGSADLAQVIQQALSMVRYSRRFKRVELELRGLERPVPVAGEAGRLEQLFINLLLNAARATGGQGTITVEVRAAPGSPGDPGGAGDRPLVEVVVEDDGPGIPEEDLDRIFDPFFTRAGSDDGGGLGLGLFISYGIVDAHGGTLWAENRQEGGARFVIRLPADEGVEAVST